jgi:Ca-activated chloride channel family protein
MARFVVALLGGLTLLILSSCGEPGVYLDVIEGNYAFSRGDYMTANLEYIRAERQGAFLPRIHYNLGNVYHALGESEAALDEWERAGDADDESTMYRIAFNHGVLYYESGDYQGAYRAFRRALKFRPDDIEAKVNLEYSLRKQSLKDSDEKPEVSDSEDDSSVSDDGKRILEYVKRSAPTRLVPEERRQREEEVKEW